MAETYTCPIVFYYHFKPAKVKNKTSIPKWKCCEKYLDHTFFWLTWKLKKDQLLICFLLYHSLFLYHLISAMEIILKMHVKQHKYRGRLLRFILSHSHHIFVIYPFYYLSLKGAPWRSFHIYLKTVEYVEYFWKYFQ